MSTERLGQMVVTKNRYRLKVIPRSNPLDWEYFWYDTKEEAAEAAAICALDGLDSDIKVMPYTYYAMKGGLYD